MPRMAFSPERNLGLVVLRHNKTEADYSDVRGLDLFAGSAGFAPGQLDCGGTSPVPIPRRSGTAENI